MTLDDSAPDHLRIIMATGDQISLGETQGVTRRGDDQERSLSFPDSIVITLDDKSFQVGGDAQPLRTFEIIIPIENHEKLRTLFNNGFGQTTL